MSKKEDRFQILVSLVNLISGTERLLEVLKEKEIINDEEYLKLVHYIKRDQNLGAMLIRLGIEMEKKERKG
jgi:hypothetical protein